jgi:hypothetical protein
MSYPLCDDFAHMNENQNVEKRNRLMELEQLAPEKQSEILEMALNASLVDVSVSLRRHGIHTSPSALSRFVRRDRERKMLEERKEMAGTVEAFAEAGRDGKLREGTLEAVRQRMYERAIVSRDPEEARELFAAMAREEAKFRELELEARKVAAHEQQVKLQGLKIQVLAEKGAGAGKGIKKVEVVDSQRVEGNERAKLEVRAGLAGGPGVAAADERAKLELGGPGGSGVDEEKERLLVMLREVNEIVNRGGSTDEKVLEVRARLAGEAKMLEAGS